MEIAVAVAVCDDVDRFYFVSRSIPIGNKLTNYGTSLTL